MLSSTPNNQGSITPQEHQVLLSSAGNHNLLSSMCGQTKLPPMTNSSSGNKGVAVPMQQRQQPLARPISSAAWQTSADIPDRLNLLGSIRNIVMEKLLKSPGATTQKLSKLPVMTRKMEEILYRAAQTKEEYTDLSTLQARLQMIARALESRSDRNKSNRSSSSSGSWQSSQDKQDRLNMLLYIKKLVKKQLMDKCGGSILHKLPQAAKMMEAALYRSAPTKDHYMDVTTLSSRLQVITDNLLSGNTAT